MSLIRRLMKTKNNFYTIFYFLLFLLHFGGSLKNINDSKALELRLTTNCICKKTKQSKKRLLFV